MRTTLAPANSLPIFFENKSRLPEFRTVVSLHGHTLYSRENLGFINTFARRVPVLRLAMERGAARYREVHGTELDVTRAWWTPPLAPYAAWRLEADRIASRYHARPLVSLSDHDDIEAGVTLRVLDECASVPVSVEWTVPFDGTFFHIGVHNLPPDRPAASWRNCALSRPTPTNRRWHDLFASLHARCEVLVVFNHPCWDECEVGRALHMAAARRFVASYGAFLHAFEINGLRPWAENRMAIDFAVESSKPVISGGDRHALEANTVLNLTNAETFEEFVEEMRGGRQPGAHHRPVHRAVRPPYPP